jgi:AcrR family transcriptional regulator
LSTRLDNTNGRSIIDLIVSKGEATRERIVDRALRLASRDGLEGLSIGGLATDLGLSKSGLFAHFGSKEDLQLAVLHEAVGRFEATVIRPAIAAARGEPRVRGMFERWMSWMADPAFPGGCILLAASVELDDREGRPRDYLAGTQRLLLSTLARAARIAVEVGHFRADLDCDQFAFELYALVLARGHWTRLLRDPQADARARRAFDDLLGRVRTPS